jgi:hypothetical protein
VWGSFAKVFSWSRDREPGAPSLGTWTLKLPPRTRQQSSIILRWAERLSWTLGIMSAIQWLRRTFSDQMLDPGMRQRLRWGRELVFLPCICRGRTEIDFEVGIAENTA